MLVNQEIMLPIYVLDLLALNLVSRGRAQATDLGYYNTLMNAN